MSTAGGPNVAIVAAPPATATTVVWRRAGELRVTVVVKAAFVIVPEGPMALAEPEAIITAEVHHGGSVARSVRLTADNAPRVPQPEVLLTGSACAPEGQTVHSMSVRLALFREAALLDKTLYVYGDDGGAAPFERIPLVYERAYGGLGFTANPLGTGILELASKPNLLHRERAAEVACFAPIARTWPQRRRLVSPAARKGLDAPLMEIPDDLDWSYFQASPADQRVARIVGDEWVVLEGMSATMPRLRSRLPSARALAVVHGASDLPGSGLSEGGRLDLVADTLRIDADRLGCTVVWRGDFAVAGEEALAALRIYAGVEAEGAPIVWPAPAPAPAEGEEEAAEEIIELDSDVLLPLSTVTLENQPEGEEPVKPAVPFVASLPGAAPVILAEPTAPLPDLDRGHTVALPEQHFGETLAVASDLSPVSLPFAGRRVAAVEIVPLPHWSPEPAAPAAPAVMPAAFAAEPSSSLPHAEPRVAKARTPEEISPHGIHLHNGTPLALGVFPWGAEPSRDCFTVVAKATCDLVPGEKAALREQADPLGGEVVLSSGCARPSDLAPFKVRADVVAVGHAHAPGGAVEAMDVAFHFGHEGNAFARTLRVFGDRLWARTATAWEPGPPQQFLAMALVHARAFGGPGYAANPLGRGLVDRWRHARALPPLPNLEDPDARLRIPSQRPAPACFAPLPSAWRAPAERRAPWARLPEDLDWTAHQVAPPAQRLGFLRGDEPFTLTGMHRTHAELAGELPGLTVRAFAVRPGDVFEEVPLRLDTVSFDVDALTVTLLWRGTLPVAGEEKPDVLAVHLLTEKLGAEPLSLDAARAKLGA